MKVSYTKEYYRYACNACSLEATVFAGRSYSASWAMVTSGEQRGKSSVQESKSLRLSALMEAVTTRATASVLDSATNIASRKYFYNYYYLRKLSTSGSSSKFSFIILYLE